MSYIFWFGKRKLLYFKWTVISLLFAGGGGGGGSVPLGVMNSLCLCFLPQRLRICSCGSNKSQGNVHCSLLMTP